MYDTHGPAIRNGGYLRGIRELYARIFDPLASVRLLVLIACYSHHSYRTYRQLLQHSDITSWRRPSSQVCQVRQWPGTIFDAEGFSVDASC